MKSPKKITSLAVIIGVGVVCVVSVLIATHRLGTAKKEYASLYQKLQDYRETIWKVKDVQIVEVDQELRRLNQRFSTQDQLSLMIKEISDTARTYNVKVKGITPAEKGNVGESEPELASFLNRIRLDMRLEGSFANLAAFLTDLGALNNGLIRTSNFRLLKSASGSSDLDLILQAYLYIRSQPDQDLLKEISLSPSSFTIPQTAVSRFQDYHRNPFVQEIIVGPQKAQLSLEGIIYDPAQPIALINGEAKKVGDQVDNAKILEIHRSYVVLQRENEQIEIRLGPE